MGLMIFSTVPGKLLLRHHACVATSEIEHYSVFGHCTEQ
jgi:hypothetical protein